MSGLFVDVAFESKDFPNKPNNKSADQAEKDHCNDGEIKSEIFLFNSDITGQTSDPVQLIMKKINDDTDKNNDHSNSNDPFAGFAVHIAKLK